ncbi:MBL fold metallo-hydrolase [Henriciella litoralis]|uniref:hypothetical protein n=1 Tax=Henriciella litoralis TaxID=568102 RepID=UPI000A02CD32|nr:hypothetical protein [Henriciella litoralis]
MKPACLAGLFALALAACDGAGPGETQLPAAPEPASSPRPDVRPADFALIPCSHEESTICLLVLAGGKRLLFGTPAGTADNLTSDDLALLDAVFLVSLRPDDVEGLDEVRNRSWRAGRPDVLAVTGPEGSQGLIDGLNAAYEISDALSFVEDGAPAGGFDAALLSVGTEINRDTLVFDTGDLKVRGISQGTGRVTYRVIYRDIAETWHELVIRPCRAPEIAPSRFDTSAENQTSIGCKDLDLSQAWPMKDALFLVKTSP